ncbi:hypothetical protein [Nonomuraea roseoviolacea]|uniref:hypothetical protein n=1 Tax=Nonomuraea roseoviolacea TaxID=103837 RepID=UPI0031E3C19B
MTARKVAARVVGVCLFAFGGLVLWFGYQISPFRYDAVDPGAHNPPSLADIFAVTLAAGFGVLASFAGFLAFRRAWAGVVVVAVWLLAVGRTVYVWVV